MTEHSRVIAALTLTAVTKPVRSIPTRPPAAGFLSRERNRGKSAAGLRPCTPVQRALKRRGQRRGGEQAGAERQLADFESAWQWSFAFQGALRRTDAGIRSIQPAGGRIPAHVTLSRCSVQNSRPPPLPREGGSNGGNRRAVFPLAGRRGPGEPFGRCPGRSFGSFPIAGKGTHRGERPRGERPLPARRTGTRQKDILLMSRLSLRAAKQGRGSKCPAFSITCMLTSVSIRAILMLTDVTDYPGRSGSWREWYCPTGNGAS